MISSMLSRYRAAAPQLPAAAANRLLSKLRDEMPPQRSVKLHTTALQIQSWPSLPPPPHILFRLLPPIIRPTRRSRHLSAAALPVLLRCGLLLAPPARLPPPARQRLLRRLHLARLQVGGGRRGQASGRRLHS